MSHRRQALVRRAAHAYVAGPSLGDAIIRCQRAGRAGLASTVGFWSDQAHDPSACLAAYTAAVDRLALTRLDCYLSIKAPALGSSASLAGSVVERATAARMRVHVDAMGWEDADAAFGMLDAIRPLAPRLGCTLPGRWRRSVEDVERAAEQRLDVRVVKGEWVDPTQPARDERRGFLEVVDLLVGRVPHVAVATHDAPLASAALRRLQRGGTPCELEVLLGWPGRGALGVARALGVPVRLYVPYGSPHLPYDPALGRLTWRFLIDLARAQLGHFLRTGEESVRDSA